MTSPQPPVPAPPEGYATWLDRALSSRALEHDFEEVAKNSDGTVSLVFCLPLARAELAALRAHVARLEAGIHAVREMIEESHGVDDLQGNGVVAPWDDLLRGGQLEDWLRGFSDAQAAIAERALKEAKP